MCDASQSVNMQSLQGRANKRERKDPKRHAIHNLIHSFMSKRKAKTEIRISVKRFNLKRVLEGFNAS
jgi:hypothetical protein